MIKMSHITFIGLGGALGAITRYLCTLLMLRCLGSSFPYGTLFVNVLGSVLMGLLVTIFAAKSITLEPLALVVMVGFLGAFTTYSAFSLDTINFLINAQVNKAFLNILLNTALCISAAYFGICMGRFFLR